MCCGCFSYLRLRSSTAATATIMMTTITAPIMSSVSLVMLPPGAAAEGEPEGSTGSPDAVVTVTNVSSKELP